ncbi:pantetheine-phosphate adenylyltransferase [Alkalibacterium iburiense]|uniref:Phosphopantetheine adenylyltransferase n=1 Tax=Alkalibacterium iburiense TaxID=290589 RepID=A0ABN0XK78_9LACT
MTKALYVGSFDPITNGHIDIIKRASQLFGEVIVVASASTAKKYVFTLEERLKLIETSLEQLNITNTQVMSYDGLTINLAEELKADVLIRGIRSVKDMEYESDIAQLNKLQNDTIETVLLFSDVKYQSISSTMVKEIAFYKGDLSALVPETVEKALTEKFNERR